MDAPAGPAERLTAFGNELIEIHVWLREELARLRADVGSYLDGRGELDGLAAILESHFAFEERRIVTALNALPSAAGTTESLLGASATRWPALPARVARGQ